MARSLVCAHFPNKDDKTETKLKEKDLPNNSN